MPPLLRPLPHVESIILFRAEEPEEETELRQELGLRSAEQCPASTYEISTAEDIIMSLPPKSKDIDMVASNVPPFPNQTSPFHHFEPLKNTAQPAPPPTLLVVPWPTPQKAPPSLGPPRIPSPTPPQLLSAPVEMEDDEEMPVINMDSDSDAD